MLRLSLSVVLMLSITILILSLLVWDLLLFLVSAFAMLALILAVDQHSTFTTYHAWAALLLIMVQRNAKTNSNPDKRKMVKYDIWWKFRRFLEFVGPRSPMSSASLQIILPLGADWSLLMFFFKTFIVKSLIFLFPFISTSNAILIIISHLKVCVPHYREHFGGMHCAHCGVHVEVLPWPFVLLLILMMIVNYCQCDSS